MNKKIKNYSLLSVISFIACLMPFIIILGYWLFICISNSGVTTQNMDYKSVFLEPFTTISDINIFGLNTFNSWLLNNVILVPSETNDFIKYSISFGLFIFEYYLFIYIVNIAIKVLTFLPNTISKYFDK